MRASNVCREGGGRQRGVSGVVSSVPAAGARSRQLSRTERPVCSLSPARRGEWGFRYSSFMQAPVVGDGCGRAKCARRSTLARTPA